MLRSDLTAMADQRESCSTMVKNSSIVSIMAIFDLTTQGRDIVADTAMPFEIWFTIAAMYLCITLLLSALATLLEHKLATPTH